jgi:hypothetical protein
MTPAESMFPPAVFVIWWTGLIFTLVFLVPMAVYWLHRAWVAARGIQRYSAEALEAAAGVAGNTKNIVALDTTIEVATQILENAGNVAGKLGTIADVLEERAR